MFNNLYLAHIIPLTRIIFIFYLALIIIKKLFSLLNKKRAVPGGTGDGWVTVVNERLGKSDIERNLI